MKLGSTTSIFLLLLILLSPQVGIAQSKAGLKREWTSADGRTVEMELREISGESGVFFLAGDRRIELPLAKLADGDREVAQEWWDSRPIPLLWPEMVEVETRTLEVAALPKGTRDGWFLYRTEHFEFHSQAELTTSLVKDIARVFEATLKLIEEIPWGIEPAPAEGDYFLAELYKSRSDYERAGGPSNSGGVYTSREKKFMVPFESLELEKVGGRYTRSEDYEVNTLVHEITHQAMHFWLQFLPKWFIEGSAEFTEVIPYHYGKFRHDRIEVGLKKHVEELFGNSEADVFELAQLFEMSHEQWNELSGSYSSQRKLYKSSLLLTYYFMHLDGDGDGSRVKAYLSAVRGLKNDWQNFLKAYETYEQEFAVFLKEPGVEDNGDGTFTYPSNLTPPPRPERPLPEDEMDRPELTHLDKLLDGRSLDEVQEEMKAKFQGIGIRIL